MQETLLHFKRRRLAIVRDDVGALQRAILVAPAAAVDAELVNQAVTISRGVCFVALSPERVGAFLLSKMSRPQTGPVVQARGSSEGMDICVSVEAREGVSTGISSADRAVTVAILGEGTPNPRRLVHPGHIFPVETRLGGVLVRNALPESAVDLVTISGYSDAAMFFDIIRADGEFAEIEEQSELARAHDLPVLLLSDLLRYRLQHERLVTRVAEARLPTARGGELRSIIYRSEIHDGEHLVLTKGKIDSNEPVAVRVQTEFTFSDVFGGESPPSRRQISAALELINDLPAAVLVYLRRPYRGQLREQILAKRDDAPPAPITMMREYGLGAQILRDLGVRKAILISNTERQLAGLPLFGIEVVSQQPLPGPKAQKKGAVCAP